MHFVEFRMSIFRGGRRFYCLRSSAMGVKTGRERGIIGALLPVGQS
jgi:hypothetical protein